MVSVNCFIIWSWSNVAVKLNLALNSLTTPMDKDRTNIAKKSRCPWNQKVPERMETLKGNHFQCHIWIFLRNRYITCEGGYASIWDKPPSSGHQTKIFKGHVSVFITCMGMISFLAWANWIGRGGGRLIFLGGPWYLMYSLIGEEGRRWFFVAGRIAYHCLWTVIFQQPVLVFWNWYFKGEMTQKWPKSIKSKYFKTY